MLAFVEVIKSKILNNTVIAQVLGINGQGQEREVWSTPGVRSCPPTGAVGVWLPIGGDKRVVVAMQNYRIDINLAQGETAVYSTNADGDTVEAVQVFRADGTIEINGASKSFVTHAELDTALQALVTAINAHVHVETGASTAPPTTPMTLDISAAATTTVKTGG